MITKPGGITTSEAMAMELPMLLYNPLPGQEQDNAQFLVQAGVAMLAENLTDLKAKLLHLLFDPKLLKNMKENTRLLSKKRSTFDALDVIVQMKRKVSIPNFSVTG
jgi:processive 1,2-diacylglycerol beta-glucosyltransferase